MDQPGWARLPSGRTDRFRGRPGAWARAAFLPGLPIEGIGEDERDALESFADDFAETRDTIAAAPDSRLTGDARALKQTLRRLVAKVEPLR